jgi:hypothetical protein
LVSFKAFGLVVCLIEAVTCRVPRRAAPGLSAGLKSVDGVDGTVWGHECPVLSCKMYFINIDVAMGM